MNDLIEALRIFEKYADSEFGMKYPFSCEHDILLVTCVEENSIPEDESARLEELGFFKSEEYDCWASYQYGSS